MPKNKVINKVNITKEYSKERVNILTTIFKILDIKPEKNYFLPSLIDINKQLEILNLEDDIRKYFICQNWCCISNKKTIINRWLSLVKYIIKYMGYNIDIISRTINGKSVKTYYLTKLNEDVLNSLLEKQDNGNSVQILQSPLERFVDKVSIDNINDVKKYIEENYTKTLKKTDRILTKDFHSQILTSFNTLTRNIISAILKHIGLNRLQSNGKMYYYGIIKKNLE